MNFGGVTRSLKDRTLLTSTPLVDMLAHINCIAPSSIRRDLRVNTILF